MGETCSGAINRFCRSIPPDDRKKLCAICTKRHIEKNEVIDCARYVMEATLILDGALVTATTVNGRIQFLHTACDIIGTEYLFNDKRVRYDGLGLVRAFRDTEIAAFPVKELRRLFMETPSIAKALYSNLAVLDNRKSFYRIMTSIGDARHAVLYMLLYLKKRGIENPTHEEIAFLSGLTRVTVTNAIRDINRSYRFDDLDDYIMSMIS